MVGETAGVERIGADPESKLQKALGRLEVAERKLTAIRNIIVTIKMRYPAEDGPMEELIRSLEKEILDGGG